MYKRLLTIQDISCVGQCSLTVALPIISACGVEACVLPSAVLSTYTGGFVGYTFRDLTDDFPAISEHWKQEGIKFDSFYTGYLGSIRQVEYVQNLIELHSATDAKVVIDPVMADNGKFYPSFDQTFVEAMKKLVKKADVVLPNITEAALLAGMDYREEYDESYIKELLSKVAEIGAKTVIITSVSYNPESTGVAILHEGEYRYYEHKKIQKVCHGTGDIFASVFSGSLTRGIELFKAAQIAADFTLKSIENTLGDESHWYGVKFETALPYLVNRIHEACGE